MIFVWGQQRVDTSLGYVAEFCNVCRQITPCKLLRVGVAGHVYKISVGQGALAGHAVRCQCCQAEFAADPAQYAGTLKTLPPAPVGGGVLSEELVRATNPEVAARWAERLALEDQLRRDPSQVPAETRQFLLQEVLARAARAYDQRAGQSLFNKAWDAWVGLGCVTTMMLQGLVPIVLLQMAYQGNAEEAGSTAMMVGAALFVVLLYTEPWRYLQRKLVPELKSQLRPLKPTEAELTEALASFPSLSKRLKAARLLTP